MSDRVDAARVTDKLSEYGELTARRLGAYLVPRQPFRNLHALATDYPTRGGRMLRASLCIATARALGATTESALPAAAAIELMHNAFLVHDDIEDESLYRRGRRTLHELHGTPLAVNAGDALSALALGALLDSRRALNHERVLRLVQQAQQTIRAAVEGQAMELGWRRDNTMDLTETDYFAMIIKKTCAYTTVFPMVAGAIVAGDTDMQARCLPFALTMGCAFQIQDDLLNLVGDEARYGKELNGDLLEGKRTLMLLHLMQALDERDRRKLRTILARTRCERGAEDIGWIRQRMDFCGSLAYARRYANQLAGAAEFEFDRAFGAIPNSPDKQFLAGLGRWVIERA